MRPNTSRPRFSRIPTIEEIQRTMTLWKRKDPLCCSSPSPAHKNIPHPENSSSLHPPHHHHRSLSQLPPPLLLLLLLYRPQQKNYPSNSLTLASNVLILSSFSLAPLSPRLVFNVSTSDVSWEIFSLWAAIVWFCCCSRVLISCR